VLDVAEATGSAGCFALVECTYGGCNEHADCKGSKTQRKQNALTYKARKRVSKICVSASLSCSSECKELKHGLNFTDPFRVMNTVYTADTTLHDYCDL
jgi:hypothetical protein